jgi:hypothetical protein
MFGSSSELSATTTPIGCSCYQQGRLYSTILWSCRIKYGFHKKALGKCECCVWRESSYKNDFSPKVSGNIWVLQLVEAIKHMEGSHRCTGLRSQRGAWFLRLLGGYRYYIQTYERPCRCVCDYYRVVEQANWLDPSVAFDEQKASDGLTVHNLLLDRQKASDGLPVHRLLFDR